MELEEVREADQCSDAGASPEASKGAPDFQELLGQQRASLLRTIDEALEEHFRRLALAARAGEEGAEALIARLATSSRSAQEENGSGVGRLSSARCNRLGSEQSSRVVAVPSFAASNSVHSFGSLQRQQRVSAQQTSAAREDEGRAITASNQVPRLLQRLVMSDRFEFLCAMLILSNALLYGVEAQYQATHPDGAHHGTFLVLAKVYTALFTLELVVRIGAEPRTFFCSKNWHWNAFDTGIVVASLLELSVPDLPQLSFLRIIRLTRMARLLRMVQYFRVFTGLRILVSSVLNTMRSLAWTLFLLASILYVFGLLFTQTALEYLSLAGSDPEVADGLRLHFGSLLRSVATLFRCITGGVSWGEVVDPLSAVHPLWELAFIVFISFTCLAVLNVVTGVFCQSAIESASRDKDGIVQNQLSMMEKYTNELRALFRQLDRSRSGVVTLPMFEEFLQDSQIKAYFDGLDMSCDDAWNLWKLLDSDGSHTVDVEEFVQGCLKLQGSARSIDTHMLLYESRWSMKRLHDISASLQQLGSLLEANFYAGDGAYGEGGSEEEGGYYDTVAGNYSDGSRGGWQGPGRLTLTL